MHFEHEARYRGRVVQAQIERIPDSGNEFVEAMIEVVAGPLVGRRLKWNGWLNSPDNVKRTIEQLRAAGWTGTAFPAGLATLSDWRGLGSIEIEFPVALEKRIDEMGKEKVYPRATFLNVVPTLRARNPVDPGQVSSLNRKYAALLGGGLEQPVANGGTPLPHAPAGVADADIPF